MVRSDDTMRPGRAQRPVPEALSDLPRLTARSVIASTLLGVSPPELPTRVLVATAELLGVQPGAARVALSRMVAAEELTPVGDGYRLAGHLVTRQARQDLSRLGAPSAAPWDGRWSERVVLAESARSPADRAALRSALGALRFGELREGVWLRPANLPAGVLGAAEEVVGQQTVGLWARPEEPAGLVAQLWDLSAWADRGTTLADAVAEAIPALEDGEEEALAPAFVLLAAALRHLQADPLLPAELLPDHWPGPKLRARQARADAAFKSTIAAWQAARR